MWGGGEEEKGREEEGRKEEEMEEGTRKRLVPLLAGARMLMYVCV